MALCRLLQRSIYKLDRSNCYKYILKPKIKTKNAIKQFSIELPDTCPVEKDNDVKMTNVQSSSPPRETKFNYKIINHFYLDGTKPINFVDDHNDNGLVVHRFQMSKTCANAIYPLPIMKLAKPFPDPIGSVLPSQQSNDLKKAHEIFLKSKLETQCLNSFNAFAKRDFATSSSLISLVENVKSD